MGRQVETLPVDEVTQDRLPADAPEPAPPATNPPHVVMIFIDALRADMIGTLPDGQTPMPTLTALAEESIVFRRAISTGSWTLAAMPGIMISNYATAFGGVWSPLPADSPTLAERFAAAGYDTIGVAANYLLDTALGYDRGFRMFRQMGQRKLSSWFDNIRGAWRLLPSPTWHRLIGLLGIKAYPFQNPDADDVVAAAESFMANRTGQPLFLWAHTMDTHGYYHPRAVPSDHRLRAEAWLAAREYHRANRLRQAPPAPILELLWRQYSQAAARVDAALARLFDYLREIGLWDDTIIIVTADHGEEFGEHGLIDHRSHHLFDETVHVPLLIRLPGAERGRVVDDTVSMIDLGPTLLDLCDIATPEVYRGQSLRPLWEGRARPDASDALITESGKPDDLQVAVRQGNYKLIIDADRPEMCLMFDLENDPAEQHNIADAEPEVVARLSAVLATHLAHGEEHATAALDDELRERLENLGYLTG